MDKRTMTFSKMNIAIYLSGFLTIGLGVNVMKYSNLGNGAWDTVTINIRSFFQNIVGWNWVSIGMISLLISLIIFAIVINYRRDIRFITMLIPIILVAVSIDFWNLVLFHDDTLPIHQLYPNIIYYIVGVLILPLGLTLVMKSTFPAFVFDELMRMLVFIFKAKKITYVRLLIEITGLTIGTIFGYLGVYVVEGSLGAVNWGSIVFTIILSPIMTMWFFVLKVPHNE